MTFINDADTATVTNILDLRATRVFGSSHEQHRRTCAHVANQYYPVPLRPFLDDQDVSFGTHRPSAREAFTVDAVTMHRRTLRSKQLQKTGFATSFAHSCPYTCTRMRLPCLYAFIHSAMLRALLRLATKHGHQSLLRASGEGSILRGYAAANISLRP